MQYSTNGYRLGYYIICFSPIISLLLLAIPTLANEIPLLIYIKMVARIHISIIAIQLSGLALHFLGSVLHLLGGRNQLVRPSFLLNPILVSILLVIWGFLTTLWAYSRDIEILLWSRVGGNRELTVWDHMQYLTWIIKGLIWIISGLVILVTAPKSQKETN